MTALELGDLTSPLGQAHRFSTVPKLALQVRRANPGQVVQGRRKVRLQAQGLVVLSDGFGGLMLGAEDCRPTGQCASALPGSRRNGFPQLWMAVIELSLACER